MSARQWTAESILPKYQGEVQDYYIEWSGRIAPAVVTATSGTGAWSLNGETGSAWQVFVASGLSASALSLTQVWTAYNSASGAGLTGTGSASALVSLRSTLRVSGGWPASASGGLYGMSAELRTSSGRFLYERAFIQVNS